MKKILILLFTVCILLGNTINSFAFDEIQPLSEQDRYDYPVKPGTSEWTKINDHTVKIAVCQILEETLKNMSTKKLVRAVLDYPLLIDMYVYDSFEEGFQTVSSYFNGLAELIERPDSASELLKFYQMAQPVTTAEFDKTFNGAPDTTPAKNQLLYSRMLELNTLEAFLAQKLFYEKLKDSEMALIKKEAGKKYEIKSKESTVYSRTTATFYDLFGGKDTNMSQAATAYDGYLIIGDKQFGYYNAGVYTPRGSYVPVFNVQQDYTATEKAQIANSIAVSYPNAVFLREATATYNCHSYAWNSTSGQYWMNSPSSYMTDGSYTSCSPAANVKVVYKKTNGALTHSGIVTALAPGASQLNYNYADLITVTSKWGAVGLFSHSGTDNPYWNGDGGVSTNRVYYYK